MADVRVLVIRAPGTNCDIETAYAWELAGACAQIVHINALIDKPALLTEARILTVPGGFCYGDDISAGKILASRIELFLSESLREFVAAGKLILGICAPRPPAMLMARSDTFQRPVSRSNWVFSTKSRTVISCSLGRRKKRLALLKTACTDCARRMVLS